MNTFKLKIDDEILFSGDEITIGLLYNNLSGVNFTDREKEHGRYLRRMQDVAGVRTGNLKLIDKRDNIIKNQNIKVNGRAEPKV